MAITFLEGLNGPMNTWGERLPDAGTISIRETIDLLDGAYSDVSQGVSEGQYAFWLGSGISRERVTDLNGVLAKLLDFLRINATGAADCPFKKAFDTIVEMAKLSDDERGAIDLGRPVREWSCAKLLLARLWNQYSKVLSVTISGQGFDYLLWSGLDFKNTFASQEPDAEHLAIGMLALEGVVTRLATANWDGLLEAAMAELGHPDTYGVTVTGDDLRGPAAAAILYKFHGCALRAINSEVAYRPLLVARSAQITGWMSNDTFKIVREQLEATIQTSRTMVMGLSAQDENIKNLFGKANTHKGWKWTDTPVPIVFSANDLGDDQKSLLNVAYGDDYEPNHEAICNRARLQAYAKPLLLALLLQVFTGKLQVLANDAVAPSLNDAARKEIADGITQLRNRAADADSSDRVAFVRTVAAALARARHQLQNGTSEAGVQPYFAIDDRPAHMMRGKVALAASGQREAAVALGLIGLENKDRAWTPLIDDPADPRSGALRLSSKSTTARVFLAANDDNVTSLITEGAFSEDDKDVVVICSRKVSGRQQRSPRATYRDGSHGPRYISFGTMLANANDLDDLRDNFRNEVSI